MRAPAPCARLEPKRGTCRPRTEHAAARRLKSCMTTRRDLANAIRALSMDAVQRANSGHPGMPMGMADVAQVLWADFLRHNPANPRWADRDRFVLSNGHGSMLLYSLLYLTGYPLTIEDLQHFRQLGSKTPGHPEYDPHCGIETTTGPLRQGLANAGDRPSLICCKTIIGYGAPHRQGTKEAHSEALGAEEVAAARLQLGWPHAPFVVPEEIRAAWDQRVKGAALEAAWRELLARYAQAFPAEAREFERRMRGDLPRNWQQTAAQTLETLLKQAAPQATRQSAQAVLNVLAPALPEIVGGSADLTGSNNTLFKGARTITPAQAAGDYLHYGVREFGMTAIMNGISLHGGFIVYGGTFLVFSDYARNAVRLGCLMSLRVILVYTHDSIGLGEDGPTHQPIRH